MAPFSSEAAYCYLGASNSYSPNIESLPIDILSTIFQKLDSCDTPRKNSFRSVSCVSKRWLFAANASRRSLSISGFKASKMEKILSRFSNLRSLNLCFLFDCTEEVLSQVGRMCPNLVELHISDSYKHKDGGSGIVEISIGCPKLQTLSMSGFKGSEEALIALSYGCRRLRSLRLRSAVSLTDSAMRSIARNCTGIEDLDISFTSITDDALYAIGDNLSMLTYLDIKHDKRVTGEGIARVAQGCPLLKVLHLGVVQVGDMGLLSIGRKCKLLEELYLEYGNGQWGRYSKEAMAAVASGCKKLKILSLRGNKQVDDDNLLGFEHVCNSLTDFDLHACRSVTDVGLNSIIKGCKQMKNLTLTDTMVGSSGESCFSHPLPNLKLIRLNNDAITDPVMMSVSKTCHGIEDMYLSNCINVSDEGLKYVVSKCHRLKLLSIKSSSLVSGSAFSTSCTKLETLILSACGITDEGLSMISGNCKELVHLSIPSCRKVTASGLIKFVKSTATLKELIIAGCSQITREQVISIAKSSCHNLKTLRVSRPDSPEDEYTIKRMHGGWVLPNWARN